MADEKQGQTSGKPNKFNEQNKGTEERKAADNPRQGEPAKEPTTETNDQSSTTTETRNK
jgi:hypothetical protein